MTNLWLIRHGETDWDIEGRWQGQADIPLNAAGRLQALTLAQQLQRISFSAIYTSDLIRAEETAAVLAHRTGLPLQRDSRLREIDQGKWEGLRLIEIETHYARLYQQHQIDPFSIAPPNGETAAQVLERVGAAVQDIVRRYPKKDIALVGHGFVFALLKQHYESWPKEILWDLIPATCKPQVLSL